MERGRSREAAYDQKKSESDAVKLGTTHTRVQRAHAFHTGRREAERRCKERQCLFSSTQNKTSRNLNKHKDCFLSLSHTQTLFSLLSLLSTTNSKCPFRKLFISCRNWTSRQKTSGGGKLRAAAEESVRRKRGRVVEKGETEKGLGGDIMGCNPLLFGGRDPEIADGLSV